jgi:hypothetical protein
MSELKSLCSFLSHSVKKGLSKSKIVGSFLRGGQLTVLQQKHNQIKNIHTWTSAFINFMGIMLEKWPGKAQVYLNYMHVIRLAASRVLDMSELKSLCSFLSHSVRKGLSGADTYSSHSSTSTSAHDD